MIPLEVWRPTDTHLVHSHWNAYRHSIARRDIAEKSWRSVELLARTVTPRRSQSGSRWKSTAQTLRALIRASWDAADRANARLARQRRVSHARGVGRKIDPTYMGL